MGRERFGGGRNRGGGGRRGGGRDGGGGGGGRRGRGGRGGRRGRSSGGERGTAHSGNQRERIAVESGHLIFIDQFMLANPQFLEQVRAVVDQDPERKDEIVTDFGGVVVALEPGTYKIERDPYALSIVVHQEGFELDPQSLDRETTDHVGDVFVDTRCVAMIDRELLDDSGLLEKYQQLWFSGQDKACRDLLRDNGGAVRYGFQRLGDELSIYSKANDNVVCMWPRHGSIVENVAPEGEQSAPA